LAENGHEVFQVTRRGSGANQCDRGHARSVGQLFKDLSAAVRYVLDKTGSKKLALASVSWGGKLAAAFCSSSGNAADISSLTLVAPGIVSRVDVSSAIKLKIAACLFTRPKAKFAIPLNDPELFTDNPEMQEFLRSDPLALRRATARFMYVSRRLDRLVRRAGKGAVDMPVTLILSREDRIINSDSVRRVVMRLTEQRAEVVSLDGRHTLEFQKDPAEFHQVLARACAK